MARYYALVDGNGIQAYLKAFLLECAAIALLLLRAESRLLKFSHGCMVVLIYCYSVWVLSSGITHGAFLDSRTSQVNQESIQELEGLKARLSARRAILLRTPDFTVIWNTVATLVIFRLLIMLSNFFFVKELGRRYRS